jgi:hypothetical protein
MGDQKFKHKMKCKLPAVKYIGTALKLDYPMMRNKKACLYKHALNFSYNVIIPLRNMKRYITKRPIWDRPLNSLKLLNDAQLFK